MEIARSGVRYFTPIQSGSFLFNNILASAFGYVSGSWVDQTITMGFATKDEERWAFTLMNGKLYDPEGRFFGAYNDTDSFSISGNFTTGSYDYYYNGELICAVGQKTTQNYNHWFVECAADETIRVDPYISSATISGRLEMKSGFYSGAIWSGNFYNDHILPVTIRSGELFLHDAVEFSVTNESPELILNGAFNDEDQWNDAFGECTETVPGSYTFNPNGTLSVFSVDLHPNRGTITVNGPCYMYGAFDVVSIQGDNWGNMMIMFPNGLVGNAPIQPNVLCYETGRKFFQCFVEDGASFSPSFFFSSEGDGFVIDNFSLTTGLAHGMAFTNGHNVVQGTGGCRVIRIAHTGIQDKTGLYMLGVRLFTDYGKQEFVVSGYSVSRYRGVLSNTFVPTSYPNVSAAPDAVVSNNNFTLSTTYVDKSGVNIDRTVYAALEYISGATGQFTPVTGATITNAGGGYTSEPYIVLSIPGLDFPFASGHAMIDAGAGTITGFYFDQTGVFNQAASAASFTLTEGGGGAGGALDAVWGSTYVKSFSGNFNLITGVFGAPGGTGLMHYTGVSGFGTLTGDDAILYARVDYSGTIDNGWIKYVVTLSGMPDPAGGSSPVFFTTGIASRT